MVTLTSSFRKIESLPLDVWKKEFKDRQSPLSAAEIEDAYAATQGWAVALDQAIGESSLRDADPVAKKNLLNLTEADGSTFKSYSAHWKAFNEFMRRVYDPGYKSGVYYPGNLGVGGIVPGYDLSLAGYKVIYQGGPDCLATRGKTCANGERYDPNKPMLGLSVVNDPAAPSVNRSIAASMLRYDRWFGTVPPVEPPPSGGTVVFGRVPKPAWQDRQIPDSLNSSWDRLGQRRLYGVVYHRMLGTLWGTDNYFRQHAPGLTDWGLDHTSGETLQWVDYTGKGRSGISANKSPWASGGSGGASGDGSTFVSMFGREAINRDLSAIEISGYQTTPVSQRFLTQVINLTAYLADQARVRYDTFPLNPNTGAVFTYFHDEFQTEKDCPWDEVKKHIDTITSGAAEVMRKHQIGV